VSLTVKKQLFLTYKGLLKVLFSSRTGNAEKFQDWAEDKLFTIQLGTQEEKDNLGTKLQNINYINFRAVFRVYPIKFPCIYLLSLGSVKDLREIFSISQDVNDDSVVYKYGFTDDFDRRLKEHYSKYEKLKGVQINVASFMLIDTKYTLEGERDLREIFKAFCKKLTTTGYRELTILNNQEYNFIMSYFKDLGIKYSGSKYSLQQELQKLEHKIELIQKDMIIKEFEAQNKYNILELEFVKYKLNNKI